MENGASAPESDTGNGTQLTGPDAAGGSSNSGQPVPAPSQGSGITIYSSDQTVLNPAQDTNSVTQSPQGTWYLEENQSQEPGISQNTGQSQNQNPGQNQAVIEILNNIPPAQP
jgi:hypothetical protein